MIFRPAQKSDCNQLIQITASTLGMLSLPKDIQTLTATIDQSTAAFENKLSTPLKGHYYFVLENEQKPLSYFPFGMWGHYNEDGYKLLAKTIIENLK